MENAQTENSAAGGASVLTDVLGTAKQENGMKKLIWRLRFTVYGQKKTGWGWRLWWDWSGGTDCDEGDTPQDAADEEIYAACT